MKNLIKILVIFFLINVANMINAKSYYRIVIDPGHSYKEAENYSKIGPAFTIKKGNEEVKIYGFKKGNGKDTEYEFGAKLPSDDWDYVYNSKYKKPENRVGFIEAAINLEVGTNLARMLKNARRNNKEICGVILTRKNQGYLTKERFYYVSKDLKARAKVV